MNIELLYPSALKENTIDTLIPKKIGKYDKLRLYHKYYFDSYQVLFKCNNVLTVFGTDYYFLESDDRQIVIPYPIDQLVYEFIIDKFSINEKEDIVNDGCSYKGYQLKWWLYNHQYDRYKNFYDLLYYLYDNKFYTLTAVLEKDVYKDCKISPVFKQ